MQLDKMDWKNNIILSVAAGIVGDYICALLIEKGISILQNRKFNKKYAFGIFLIILAGTSLINGIFRTSFLWQQN
jgi:hypothetical protein